jgi:hypothetical protein
MNDAATAITERFKCLAMGCPSLVEVPVHVPATNLRAGRGWWVRPPEGWLQLVDSNSGWHGLWVCSPECAEGLAQEEHGR